MGTVEGFDLVRSSADHWRDFEHGTSLGKVGSEGGLITSDEEHSDGARITLETGTHAPFAITCGIYGWFCHTCFLQNEIEAKVQYRAMKLGIQEIMEELKEIPSHAHVVAAIEQFVKNFP